VTWTPRPRRPLARSGGSLFSFDPAVLPVLLAPDRVAAQEAALQSAEATAEASRDDRPSSFLHALARRQQTTAGGWGRVVHAASRTPPGLLVALAFLPSLAFLGRILVGGLVPRRAAAAASHAVGVVGAAGMGWWLLVLFSFQTRAGALYGQLGALTAAFMLGLALGRSPAAGPIRDGAHAEPRAAHRAAPVARAWRSSPWPFLRFHGRAGAAVAPAGFPGAAPCPRRGAATTASSPWRPRCLRHRRRAGRRRRRVGGTTGSCRGAPRAVSSSPRPHCHGLAPRRARRGGLRHAAALRPARRRPG
jgi:hypothetical protein